MTTPTEVVIFFVGLALWSEQIPNDCGVKAILPRVEHTCDGSAHGAAGAHPATGPSPVSLLAVENHQAAILFPRYNFLSQDGWGAPEELPGQKLTDDREKIVFVRLDGDLVHFPTTEATDVSAHLTGMKLAHVREQLCPARSTLRTEYQPPYSGAAAVVSVPKGVVQACLSVLAESVGRLDTRVGMKINGTLDISGGTMIDPKKLRLKPGPAGGPIQLMIVNMPESFFQATPAASEAGGISHMSVYLAMGEPGTAGCALSLRQWWDQLDPDGIPLCNPGPSLETRAALLVPDAMRPVSMAGANFLCSNTQWP